MMNSNVFDFFEKYVGLSHNVCYKHVFKKSVRKTYIHTMRAGERDHFLLHSFITSALDGVVAKQYVCRFFITQDNGRCRMDVT
jgi:hypothetical protein